MAAAFWCEGQDTARMVSGRSLFKSSMDIFAMVVLLSVTSNKDGA